MLASYLDRGCTCWSSLENKPLSRVSGMFQRRRGIKSGQPDVMVISTSFVSGILLRDAGSGVPISARHQYGRPIFIELKSRRGVASKTQKQFRLEALAAGCTWWMARSANAAMTALHRSGVPFRQLWEPPPLEPWEGPFADPHQRLPQHPEVTARRRGELRRYRERVRARKDAETAAAAGATP